MAGSMFFIDRSLGRVRLPSLLRDAGWSVITLAEHYGVPVDESVLDIEWLSLAGDRRWPVLMKDERIRYRTAEREALVANGVRAFCLTSGNLTAQAMAECFIHHGDQIRVHAVGAGPALFAVSTSDVRRIELAD